MSHLLDGEGHQHTAASQEESARPDEGERTQEEAARSHLEPSRVGEGRVGRQKHQCEQGRDNHIERLPDGFCQTFRRLRYQAFREFHWLLLKIRGKETKSC